MWDVRILSGQDSEWTLEVEGREVRVVFHDGEPDAHFTEMFSGDPENALGMLRAAEAAAVDARGRDDAVKGFGWHPDVET